MKIRVFMTAMIFCAVLISGCNQNNPNQQPQPSASPSLTDAVTTASIVDNANDFEEAISSNGTWIIAILQDLNIDKDLVVDGQFSNNKTPPVSQRKLAFYSQNENREVTNRYTLTAPQMTIKSPDAEITHGTFKGDLYVEAKNFKLIDATVDGNVYFMNDDAKNTFTMDDTSKITGKKELKK